MIELNRFKKLIAENDDRLPLLTLDEFFAGNTAENSIAPNDCDFGRPSIAEIWELMVFIALSLCETDKCPAKVQVCGDDI